ncbi:MAG: hypothetical protein F6J93_31595 [Oscillatoria sp. SIO1A7]|nr:hypothetical protein [Oscillatoria sp. SIO1A7]
MQRHPETEKIYLEIGFRSPYPNDSLKTIELFGVPGEKRGSGESVVSEKVKRFFDDLMVSKIFRESRRLPDCDFEYLKIWLYDTETTNKERGYRIPTIDNRDLKINPTTSASKLEGIYVLDNELTDREYERWKKNARSLFAPLFGQFIAPPDASSAFSDRSIADNPLVKLMKPAFEVLETMTDAVDPYARMKQRLFFNALIIQVD